MNDDTAEWNAIAYDTRHPEHGADIHELAGLGLVTTEGKGL